MLASAACISDSIFFCYRTDIICLHKCVQILPGADYGYLGEFSGADVFKTGDLLTGADAAAENGNLVFAVVCQLFDFPGK
jgi:hypothetical protein